MKALTEVEDLTAALETVKDDYQNEVWNLLTGLLGSAAPHVGVWMFRCRTNNQYTG